MFYHIYHRLPDKFFRYDRQSHANIKLPERPIAIVQANDLEHAFLLTNHIDFNWVGEIHPHVQLLVRSSMVGDVFVAVDGDRGVIGAWVVAPAGFHEYNGPRTDWNW